MKISKRWLKCDAYFPPKVKIDSLCCVNFLPCRDFPNITHDLSSQGALASSSLRYHWLFMPNFLLLYPSPLPVPSFALKSLQGTWQQTSRILAGTLRGFPRNLCSTVHLSKKNKPQSYNIIKLRLTGREDACISHAGLIKSPKLIRLAYYYKSYFRKVAFVQDLMRYITVFIIRRHALFWSQTLFYSFVVYFLLICADLYVTVITGGQKLSPLTFFVCYHNVQQPNRGQLLCAVRTFAFLALAAVQSPRSLVHNNSWGSTYLLVARGPT